MIAIYFTLATQVFRLSNLVPNDLLSFFQYKTMLSTDGSGKGASLVAAVAWKNNNNN